MPKSQLFFIALFSLILLPFNVLAEPGQNNTKSAEQTRQWLDLQKSGHAASSNQQILPGPAAAHVYERYLNSFTHPIPEYFSEVEANPFNNSR